MRRLAIGSSASETEIMSGAATESEQIVRDLVIANRILAREGVIDGFGHISARHPENSERYLMTCSRAPELVAAGDILEYDLDSTPLDADGIAVHAERFIHGEIYRARPDVMSVCHNHAYALIPPGITGEPLRPVWHMAAVMGAEVPVWDIRDDFGDTSMLVLDNAQGKSLARTLGPDTVCLMRGHGVTIAAQGVRAAVFVSVYTMLNAEMLSEARRSQRDIVYLSDGEVALASERLLGPLAQNRAWEYWSRRAGFAPDLSE